MNKYFKRAEFACKCGCGYSTVDYELLNVLTDIRIHFDSAVTITSGCRCKKHNTEIRNSASNSRHLYGIAADFKVKTIKADTVVEYLIKKYPDSYGIGRYIGWTHIDVRTGIGRWSNK